MKSWLRRRDARACELRLARITWRAPSTVWRLPQITLYSRWHVEIGRIEGIHNPTGRVQVAGGETTVAEPSQERQPPVANARDDYDLGHHKRCPTRADRRDSRADELRLPYNSVGNQARMRPHEGARGGEQFQAFAARGHSRRACSSQRSVRFPYATAASSDDNDHRDGDKRHPPCLHVRPRDVLIIGANAASEPLRSGCTAEGWRKRTLISWRRARAFVERVVVLVCRPHRAARRKLPRCGR
jgi:hypothetical protein